MQPEPEMPPVQTDEDDNYSWQASEYIFHQKPLWWYGTLWLLAAGLCAGLAFFQQWLSIAVVVVMTGAVVVYSRKPPRTLNYRIDANGVTIEDKTLPHSQFKSFSVWEDVGWHEVDLEPNKRFAPRITLICESDDTDQIVALMTQHLPRQDRRPDWIERATRYLRF
jgi:hypothetical protein